jgi:hypothetical protein
MIAILANLFAISPNVIAILRIWIRIKAPSSIDPLNLHDNGRFPGVRCTIGISKCGSR